MFYGTQVKGFLKTQEEAAEKIKGMLGRVYIETKTEMDQRLTDIEKDIQKAKGDEKEGTGALGAIRTEKENALRAIKNATGDKDKQTGALGDIVKEQGDAIEAIKKAIKDSLGKKDERNTFLWKIEEEKKTALDKIERALKGNKSEKGALKEIEEAKNTAIITMYALLSYVPNRVKKIDKKITGLEQNAEKLKQTAKKFEPVAKEVQEAHKILKEGLKGVEPRAVVSLLNVSIYVLIALSFFSLVACVLAGIAIWKSRSGRSLRS